MPKNMSHVWKSAGLNGSSSPVLPIPDCSKSIFEAIVQKVPAVSPMTKMAADLMSHRSEPPIVRVSAEGPR